MPFRLFSVGALNVRQMHNFHTSFLFVAFYFVSFLYFASSYALASDITERNFQCKHRRAKQANTDGKSACMKCIGEANGGNK